MSAKRVEVSREIGCGAQRLYEMVSDVTRMGEWSPETTGARWQGNATAAAVGAQFRGRNRRGLRKWSTKCTVTKATPGEVFAFKVTFGPVAVATWEYEFRALSPDSTEVTERWIDQRSRAFAKVTGIVIGVPNRAAHNRVGMESTLESLAKVAAAPAQ